MPFSTGKTSTVIPYFIVGIICAFSTLAVFHLPETKGKPIPDTYEDAKKQELYVMLKLYKIHSKNKIEVPEDPVYEYCFLAAI